MRSVGHHLAWPLAFACDSCSCHEPSVCADTIAGDLYEQVHIGSLKLEGEAGKFGADRHCMVFPSVRFPSIPPSERFFFVFEDEKAKKPMLVMHLIPGTPPTRNLSLIV